MEMNFESFENFVKSFSSIGEITMPQFNHSEHTATVHDGDVTANYMQAVEPLDTFELSRVRSSDLLDLMHSALEIGDKQWFNELGVKYQHRLDVEQKTREELGFTGQVL